MNELSTNQDQSNVIQGIMRSVSNYWITTTPFITTVAGYAGTGKTFTICELRKEIHYFLKHLKVAFVSFTGKASSVLQFKLTEHNAIYKTDYVGTIHGLIYKPKTIWDKKLKAFVIVGWTKKTPGELLYDLIIIDEASMVSKSLWSDLKSYQIPIIAFGDHGQLPPIGDKFNLLNKPSYKLTKIERHALNSPIISLSQTVRKKGHIPQRIYSPDVFKLSWETKECQKLWNSIKFDKDTIVLCGFNATRSYINDRIREKLGCKKTEPRPGERVVCLQNDKDIKLMNGQICKVIWVMPEEENLYRMTLESDEGEMYETYVSTKCFGQVKYTIRTDNDLQKEKQLKYALSKGYRNINYFDYGYCISVHKSQGSEWNRVILFEQRSQYWDDEYYTRWLYTAITRAKQKLFVISDYYG